MIKKVKRLSWIFRNIKYICYSKYWSPEKKIELIKIELKKNE